MNVYLPPSTSATPFTTAQQTYPTSWKIKKPSSAPLVADRQCVYWNISSGIPTYILYRHSGMANVLYCDLHVESENYEQRLKNYNQSSFITDGTY